MLTKSDFVKYAQCLKYLWLGKYKKELATPPDAAQQALFDEGYEVEAYALKMFPSAKHASVGDFKQSINESSQLIQEEAPVIFQPTIAGNDLYARCDILVYNKRAKKWDIIEVKNSTRVKDEHLIDLSFQKICLEKNGVEVSNTYLMHINNKYVRQGEIEPKKLLIAEKVTAKVRALIKNKQEEIKAALKVLKLKDEPIVPIMTQCTKPYECAFIDYCWKNIPQNSIYDLWLKEDEMTDLLDKGIVAIEDMPAGYFEGRKYEKYCLSVKAKKPIVDYKGIAQEMDKIKYPVYFLDYETYNSPIPLFDGYRPYEKVVFQYSLHVLRDEKSEPEHYEFLGEKNEDPTRQLVESLRNNIGPKGSVIVWNAAFESQCNNEMGKRLPEHKEFLADVNSRIYDLMEIFKQGYYVHKDFCNSHSIKNVLPIIVPSLSYSNLNIKEGATASKTWKKFIDPQMSSAEKEKIKKDMLVYCQLDSLAMVEIYKFLKDLDASK